MFVNKRANMYILYKEGRVCKVVLLRQEEETKGIGL